MSPDRDQPVFVSERVAIMSRAVPQPLNLRQCLKHPMTADVRPAPADQVPQRLAGRASSRAVVHPTLFQQPIYNPADQLDG